MATAANVYRSWPEWWGPRSATHDFFVVTGVDDQDGEHDVTKQFLHVQFVLRGYGYPHRELAEQSIFSSVAISVNDNRHHARPS